METISQPKMTLLEARLRKKINASMENDFAMMKDKVSSFRQHLVLKQDDILQALSSYQSRSTSEDEFQRIFECLDAIEELREYLTRRTGSVAVFFPLNMPIYALVLYGIMPALVAEKVHVRAPLRMTELMHLLAPILDVGTYFPNLEIVFASRDQFVQDHVVSADVIIFTGKLVNAQHVMRKCKKESLFLFNGWGCNPIVVGENADLDMAAAKTVQARLFSSGQDCAGPDTILVSRKDSSGFIAKLKTHLTDVPVGPYTDPSVVVGPLANEAQIRLISTLLLRSAGQIVHGGTIDYGEKIVHPTIIVSDLSRSMNFEELFAPVIYVSIYDDVTQLPKYFEHPSYVANEMYVTLFGSCGYVESLQKSIVVKDRVIFDIDRGNDEFGGYCVGASFVASNRRVIPKPILIPREIHDYLQPGSAGHKLSPGTQAKIGKQVRNAMMDVFVDNLVYGFVFGSIARQQATGSSDINTMVVVMTHNKDQTDKYTTWLQHLHERHQLRFKSDLSALVLTINELNSMVAQLNGDAITHQLPHISIHAEALSGKQCGVAGNKKLSVEYGRRVMPFSSTVQKRKMAEPQSLHRLQEPDLLLEKAISSSPQCQENSSLNLNASESVTSPSPIKAAKQDHMVGRQLAVSDVKSSKTGKIQRIRSLCRRWTRLMHPARFSSTGPLTSR